MRIHLLQVLGVSVAFFGLLASVAILAAMYYLKLGVFEMLSKHFIQMTVVAILLGVLFGIISHVASRQLPPKLLSHRANTGEFHLVNNSKHFVFLAQLAELFI